MGPPDLITTDAGKNFISKEFKYNANLMGIRIKTVPVEAHNSIGLVERYHGPLRRAYQIIIAELSSSDITKDMALQMAFKVVNDSVGPNGLVPILLVYRAYSCLAESDILSPSITQRAMAVKKAIEEVKKLYAKRQVTNILNICNRPRINTIYDLLLNSPVLV